jgi:hypothetical protein
VTEIGLSILAGSVGNAQHPRALARTAYMDNDLRALRATFLIVLPARLAAFLAFFTADLALLAMGHSCLVSASPIENALDR